MTTSAVRGERSRTHPALWHFECRMHQNDLGQVLLQLRGIVTHYERIGAMSSLYRA